MSVSSTVMQLFEVENQFKKLYFEHMTNNSSVWCLLSTDTVQHFCYTVVYCSASGSKLFYKITLFGAHCTIKEKKSF